MAYLLDADWAINSLAGRRQASAILNQLLPQRVTISWITVGELYEGAFHSANPQDHIAILREFLSSFHIVGVNDPIMERFAQLRALLRRRGELIPDFDLIVAATALHYDLIVLTFNIRHFSRIPDLRLYQQS